MVQQIKFEKQLSLFIWLYFGCFQFLLHCNHQCSLKPVCMQYVQFVIHSFTFPRISITTELPVGIRTYLFACMCAYLSAFVPISAALCLSGYLYIYTYNCLLLLQKLIVLLLLQKLIFLLLLLVLLLLVLLLLVLVLVLLLTLQLWMGLGLFNDSIPLLSILDSS